MDDAGMLANDHFKSLHILPCGCHYSTNPGKVAIFPGQKRVCFVHARTFKMVWVEQEHKKSELDWKRGIQ
jgi:hypothetical protein